MEGTAMKLALAQLSTAGLDLERNVAHTVEAIERAAAMGADLVVLPEMVATGYVMDRVALLGKAEAGDGSGPSLSAWREAARRLGTMVVGGFAEVDGERLYNAAALIDRNGEIVGRYRKLHLFGPERSVFDRGNLGLPVFDIGDCRLGILICYDLRFPEALRIEALQGAELVVVPTAWVRGFDAVSSPNNRVGQVDGALVQANLNQVFLACADQVGEQDGRRFLGRSLVVSPYGHALIGPLDPEAEDLQVVAIDLKEARQARDRGDGISPRADRREDVYSPLLGYRPTSASPEQGRAHARQLLDEMSRKRGYLLEMHEILAAWDPDFLEDYEEFLNAAFLRPQTLDRRVKELVYIGVLTALGSAREHIEAHMRAGLANGATPEEILKVLEQVLPPAGVPRFIEGLSAFRNVCGLPGPSTHA